MVAFRDLVAELPRSIEVIGGDFNETIDQILASGRITRKEATFCLLDQRTFECHWETLIKLARYKVMYYMVHASDRVDAPALMVRAHAKAVRSIPKETQLSLLDLAAIAEANSLQVGPQA